MISPHCKPIKVLLNQIAIFAMTTTSDVNVMPVNALTIQMDQNRNPAGFTLRAQPQSGDMTNLKKKFTEFNARQKSLSTTCKELEPLIIKRSQQVQDMFDKVNFSNAIALSLVPKPEKALNQGNDANHNIETALSNYNEVSRTLKSLKERYMEELLSTFGEMIQTNTNRLTFNFLESEQRQDYQLQESLFDTALEEMTNCINKLKEYQDAVINVLIQIAFEAFSEKRDSVFRKINERRELDLSYRLPGNHGLHNLFNSIMPDHLFECYYKISNKSIWTETGGEFHLNIDMINNEEVRYVTRNYMALANKISHARRQLKNDRHFTTAWPKEEQLLFISVMGSTIDAVKECAKRLQAYGEIVNINHMNQATEIQSSTQTESASPATRRSLSLPTQVVDPREEGVTGYVTEDPSQPIR